MVSTVEHRAFRLLEQRAARDGVTSKTSCLTCGFTTTDEGERLDHYPRHLYAAALRLAAGQPEFAHRSSDWVRWDLRRMADEAEQGR